MTKRQRQLKDKNTMRDIMTNKRIGNNKEVVTVDNAVDYVKKQGYLVIKPSMYQLRLLTLICTVFFFLLISVGHVSAITSFDKVSNEISLTSPLGVQQGVYKLSSNSCSVINCNAQGVTTLLKDGSLFDDLKIYNLNAKDVSKQITVFIKTTINENADISSGEDCNSLTYLNGTKYNVCSLITTKGIKTYSVWLPYTFGSVLPSGVYQWKIEATRNINEPVDWVASAFGNDLTAWAWWNSTFKFKQSISNFVTDSNIPILVIQKQNNMSSDYSDVRFLDSSEQYELGYYIRNTTATNFTVDIRKGSNSTIYMYYGSNQPILTTSNPQNVYGSSLVAFYPFDNNNFNEVVNGLNATSKGQVGFSNGLNGQGKSALFNGSATSYLSVSDTTNSPIDFTTALTIIMLVNYSGKPNPTSFGAIMKGVSGNGVYNLLFDDDFSRNQTNFRLNGQTTDGLGQNSGNNTGWFIKQGFNSSAFMLSAVYNGTTQIQYYNNSVAGTNRAYSTSITNDNNNLTIGMYNAATNTYNGTLDEIKLYSTALQGSEIAYIYNSSVSAFTLGSQLNNFSSPIISFVYPTPDNNTYIKVYNLIVNVSVNDVQFTNMTITLYNDTGIVNYTYQTINPYLKNFTSLQNGSYYVGVTAYDSYGNVGYSENRTFVILTQGIPAHVYDMFGYDFSTQSNVLLYIVALIVATCCLIFLSWTIGSMLILALGFVALINNNSSIVGIVIIIVGIVLIFTNKGDK